MRLGKVAACLALILFGVAPLAWSQPVRARAVTGQIVVRFAPGASAGERAAAHRGGRGRLLNELAARGVALVSVPAGDEQAAFELVRQYEPLIRREVRFALEDRNLGRLFDSMDVCQSVMASFFVRAASGQYDLERPEQLVSLLVVMTRNKLSSAARQQRRLKRDHRKIAADGDGRRLEDRFAELVGRETGLE